MALESASTLKAYRKTAHGIAGMNALAAVNCIRPRLQWLKGYIAILESRRQHWKDCKEYFRRESARHHEMRYSLRFGFFVVARNLREIADLLAEAEREKGTVEGYYESM